MMVVKRSVGFCNKQRWPFRPFVNVLKSIQMLLSTRGEVFFCLTLPEGLGAVYGDICTVFCLFLVENKGLHDQLRCHRVQSVL